MTLPVQSIIPEICSTLTTQHRLVVQAPPGAGKTTAIPLALLRQAWLSGSILVIQPRRLAVYGAARRMAALLGERVGEQIGYRTRYDQKVGATTRIQVITDGLFVRMIQQQPDLPQVGLIIFDEFHERSSNIDIGLALALESQAVLREDNHPLRLLIMSATLDGGHLSDWLDAPLLKSEGKSYPVQTYYSPSPRNQLLEQHCAEVIHQALQANSGDVLVFLSGMGQMRRVQQRLQTFELDASIQVLCLHARLPQDEQNKAIRPSEQGQRKIVLATNVAETSVTIEGIQIVIDSGRVKVARYDEASGMDRIKEEAVSQASADQRQGRAGRTAPGVCYRLWSEMQQRGFASFNEPQLLTTDLAPVALELSLWGCTELASYQLLNTPKPERYDRALALLQELDALDEQGRITDLGKRMAGLSLSPRLARLLCDSVETDQFNAALACAAIMNEGDPLRFGVEGYQSDIRLRLGLWQSADSTSDKNRGVWQQVQQFIRQTARRLHQPWQPDRLANPRLGEALAQAFPDHVAQMRPGQPTRYLLANGKGVYLAEDDALCGAPYLVVLDAQSSATEARVRLACEITGGQLQQALAPHLQRQNRVQWHSQRATVVVEQQLQLGALVIERQPLAEPWPNLAIECLLEKLVANKLRDLPWDSQCQQWLARVRWLRQQDESTWPDLSDENLLATSDHWLLPFLQAPLSLANVKKIALFDALRQCVDWSLWQKIDSLAPAQWTLPTGSSRLLDYAAENGPVLRAKLQEFYGLAEHPRLPGGQAILLELLSPAQRPLQVTRDLPGFWCGSYAEVAKEMRGRYPKHFWPEHPLTAPPTRGTKAALKRT